MEPTTGQLYQLQYWTLVASIAIPIVAAVVACWLASWFTRRAINEQARINFYIEKHFDLIAELYRYLCILQSDVHKLLAPVTCQAEANAYLPRWQASCEHMEQFLESFYSSQLIIDRHLIEEIETFGEACRSTIIRLAIHNNAGLSAVEEQARQKSAEEAIAKLMHIRGRIGWYCQDILRGDSPALTNPGVRKRPSLFRRLRFWSRRK